MSNDNNWKRVGFGSVAILALIALAHSRLRSQAPGALPRPSSTHVETTEPSRAHAPRSTKRMTRVPDPLLRRTHEPEPVSLRARAAASAALSTTAPGPLDLSESLQHAQADLDRLRIQRPLGFLSSFLPTDPLLLPRSQKAAVEAAKVATENYVASRKYLLESMIANYVDSEGSYEFQADLARLADNDAFFREQVAPLIAQFPQLADFPDVMRNTALPVPEFARPPAAQAQADTGESGEQGETSNSFKLN